MFSRYLKRNYALRIANAYRVGVITRFEALFRIYGFFWRW
jgi:hypothetical protein